MENIKKKSPIVETYESYFKVGESDDYVLMRADFPLGLIPPGDFKKLCIEMFRKNAEVRKNGK